MTAVHKTDVAAAEDVAVAVVHILRRTDGAAVDVYLCLAEDEALGFEVHLCQDVGLVLIQLGTIAAPVVVTAAATEHVAVNLAAIDIDVGRSRLEDVGIGIDDGGAGYGFHRAASDDADLTAAIDAAAHLSIINIYVRILGIAVGHIASTEDVTRIEQAVLALLGVGVIPVVEFLDIVGSTEGVGVGAVVAVADVAVVDAHVGRAVDGAALAAAVDVALDGGDTIAEGVAGEVADDDVGASADVVVGHGQRGGIMIADVALPSAAIDVADAAAFDVGIGGSRKLVLGTVVQTHDGTALTGGVDVLLHTSAQQTDIGVAADHSLRTVTAAIGIARDGGTLMDVDVGVVFL